MNRIVLLLAGCVVLAGFVLYAAYARVRTFLPSREVPPAQVRRTRFVHRVGAEGYLTELENTPILDLAYVEDSEAEVDMNIVCTGAGKFIEIQGTAEREPFAREQMDEMLVLAETGINKLFEIQRNALNV